MKLESEEYPYCQLNETVNMNASGQILSRSLMLNLRNESPEIVYQNYLKLKQLIDNPEKPETKIKRIKKETREKNKRNENEQAKPEACPKCGSLLVRKSGVSRNGWSYDFMGCSSWPACNFTKPVLEEEVIDLEQVPF